MSKFDWSSVGRIGKKVAGSLQEAADTVSKKTEEAVNTQKIKGEILKLTRANDRDFAEMGRLAYEIFKAGKMEDADMRVLSEEIEKREILISEKEEELNKVMKKKKCKNCGCAVEENAVFCQECGAKVVVEDAPEDFEEVDFYEEVSETVPEENADQDEDIFETFPMEETEEEITETFEETLPEEEVPLTEYVPEEEAPLTEEIPEEV